MEVEGKEWKSGKVTSSRNRAWWEWIWRSVVQTGGNSQVTLGFGRKGRKGKKEAWEGVVREVEGTEREEGAGHGWRLLSGGRIGGVEVPKKQRTSTPKRSRDATKMQPRGPRDSPTSWATLTRIAEIIRRDLELFDEWLTAATKATAAADGRSPARESRLLGSPTT